MHEKLHDQKIGSVLSHRLVMAVSGENRTLLATQQVNLACGFCKSTPISDAPH